MPATAIARATLFALDGTGQPKSGDTGFVVTFNPASLKVAYSNNLEGDKEQQGGQQRQYIGKQSTELAVELVFDTTDASVDTVDRIDWGNDAARTRARQGGTSDVDVRCFTAEIVAFMQPIAGDDPAAKDKKAPYRVRFSWGSFLFEGVLKSLQETLELFSADGVPLRATLALALSEDKLEFQQGQARSQAGQSGPLGTPSSGSTAAGFAVSAGLDPLAGKLVASINGLDDVRSLSGSAALQLPSAGAGLSLGIGGAGASGSASFGASASLGGGAGIGVGVSIGGGAAAGGAAFSGGFGGGSGLGVTLGGGGGFGLTATGGVGVSAGIGIGGGIGIGISGGAGLSLGVSGGISGGVAGLGGGSVSLPGAGSVGGPSAGGVPGAQSVMDPDGRIALSPASPPAALAPPSASAASGVATTRTPTATVSPQPAAAATSGATQVAGSVGHSTSPSSASGLPTAPLPNVAGSAPQGAFKGISGVPLKAVRFGVAAPPPRALAYRRLQADDACLDPTLPDGTATAAGTPARKKRGGACGCGH